MAMRLEKENVRFIVLNLLNGCELYGAEEKEAEHLCSYVSGVMDMANAVIHAIEDLGG